MNDSWVGVVLAAGKGVRMRSSLPKPLHPVCGRSLVSHVVAAMCGGGVTRLVAVVSKEMSEMPGTRDAVGEEAVIAIQREQRGTADALLAARDASSGASSILVGAGDMALVTPDTVRRMIESHEETGDAVTILTAEVEDPSGLGRVVRDYAGKPLRVVEEVDADDETRCIHEINTSWYCFDTEWLWQRLDGIGESNSGEKYLTDLVEAAAVEGGVSAVSAEDPAEAMGANDRVQLAAVEAAMRSRINTALMRSGVSMTDPLATYIDAGVSVGMDTRLGPGVQLQGRTLVGERCDIGARSVIRDSVIEDDVRVTESTVEESTIRSNVDVGPYSHLRPGTVVESGARIGNHAEIKNSRIGPGTHVGHFSYVGDSELGANVNIGAGTVTANFDGRDKHATVIGDGASIGSGTMIVAPVKIGKDARTGAGSVVTGDIADGETVVGVPARPTASKDKARGGK